MKELIPMDEYGVFCDAQDTARANSLMVAKVFGKRHADVLRDIEKITAPKSGLSKEKAYETMLQIYTGPMSILWTKKVEILC